MQTLAGHRTQAQFFYMFFSSLRVPPSEFFKAIFMACYSASFSRCISKVSSVKTKFAVARSSTGYSRHALTKQTYHRCWNPGFEPRKKRSVPFTLILIHDTDFQVGCWEFFPGAPISPHPHPHPPHPTPTPTPAPLLGNGLFTCI